MSASEIHNGLARTNTEFVSHAAKVGQGYVTRWIGLVREIISVDLAVDSPTCGVLRPSGIDRIE